MPTAPDRRRSGRSLVVAGLLAVTAALAVTGCGRADRPMMPIAPTATATGAPSPSGTDPASPALTASPGATDDPTGTVTPDSTASAAPVSCSSVTPIRIERSIVEPRRTTEIVTVVSDGRNLTPGTREQSAFAAPALTAPDGTSTTSDQATLTKVADLIESSSKNTVLLTRPESPDTGIDANKRPFNATGTYVLYNASGLLRADVIVQCSTDRTTGAGGQEQRWRFTAEADNTVGTINCAVEPPQGNAVARQVHGAFC